MRVAAVLVVLLWLQLRRRLVELAAGVLVLTLALAQAVQQTRAVVAAALMEIMPLEFLVLAVQA